MGLEENNMAEEPHKFLLDRNLYSVFISEYFGDSIGLLEELVDYGSHLIPRCFTSSEKKLHDVVILLTFLKHGISLIDSINILTEKGSTMPCFILLRSLFEIAVYLDWIFQKDTEKRGTLYFVWNLRKKLYWALSLKKGTPEHNAYRHHMRGTKMSSSLMGLDESSIDFEISILRKKLSAPECVKINQEYDSLKKGLKDKGWYVPGGVNNFREMAKAVNREWQYNIFYSSFSTITHGLTFDKQVSFSKKRVIFEPIRNMTEIDQIFTNTISFVLDIYERVLRHYRPGEKEYFNQKYLKEWRSRYMAIKTIKYKDGVYTIDDKSVTKKMYKPPSSNWCPSL